MSLLLVAAHGLMAQEVENGREESKLPTHGIRFVICSSTNEQLPSPLYAKMGKEYMPITISGRMPSPRVTPEGGYIKFYATMPAETKGNKAPKEEPVLTVAVPDEYKGSGVKCVCIVEPTKKNDPNPKTYFLNEAEFKRGAVHLINFTEQTLEIVTDPTGSFEPKTLKKEKIAPRVKTTNISKYDKNVWSYAGADNKNVSFVLQALPASGRGEPVRIRASVFKTSADISQISIVVKHPKIKNAFSLLSVQYSDDEERAKTARGTAR